MDSKSSAQININRYIEIYTSEEVKYRGERLYGSGTVDFKVYEEITDTWKFFVHGSQVCRVSVRGVNKDAIEATCTCPQSWGGVCMHTVASMLYISGAENAKSGLHIDEGYHENVEKRGNRLIRHTSAGSVYELKEYELIEKEMVSDNISKRVFNQLSYYSHLIHILNVEIAPNKTLFHFDNEGAEVTIKFFSEDGKVFVSSSEFSQSDTFTHTIAYCLLLIANSNTPFMLGDVFGEKLAQKEKDILNDYGLENDVSFDQYFFHSFDEKYGLTIERNNNSKGMIPVVQKEIDPLLSFLNKTSSEELYLEGLVSEKDQREFGFVLRMNSKNEESLEKYYEIIPIVGKTNKAGNILNTYINEYSDFLNLRIQKSEITRNLLDIVAELKEIKENSLLDFQINKRAFKLLAKEKYVFGLKENTYSDKKTNIQEIELSALEIDLVFEVSENDDYLVSTMRLKKGNEVLELNAIDSTKSTNEIIVINDVYYFVKNHKVSRYLADYPDSLKMVKNHSSDFFNQVIKPISNDFDFVFNENTYLVNTIELDFNKKQLFLSEQNEYVIITPQVEYDNDISALLHSSGNILVKNETELLEYKRNQELENEYIDSIVELHPSFEDQRNRRVFHLHYSEFAKNMWFYKFFDQLKTRNIEIYGLRDLKNFKYSPYKGKIDTTISSGQDWFEVDVNVSFGDSKVSISDIRKAVINKQRYIQLNDGSVGVLPAEWYTKLEKYFRNGEIKDDKLTISKLRFSIIDDLFDNIDDMELIEEIAEKRKKLSSFSEIAKTEVPIEVTAELRHYQKEGLNWLNFLHEMQWGGILADDMGLGKTLQILTFIQHLKSKENSTHLIVVPTTLLFNWEKEIEKFTPDLTTFYHYGIDRQKSPQGFGDYDIVFTTYGLLLRDIEMLREFSFNYIILDESQAIKNPASRRYKAANLVNAKNRIALSGTPIENSTFDLFAQMSFANRGFFTGANAFKENYSNPIDKEGDEAIGGELHKLINPFVLRRTKETVATELPAKTEDIIYCEMEPEQRRVYDAYRNNYKNQLVEKIAADGMGKSKIMVLEALTRLRQICDSPALVDKDYITDAQAIKVKEILRHITNKTANHKILIFSQFVKMLSIVRDELTKLNIDFEYLDGKSSTKQREKSVNNFQDNDDLRVFLISLKAGGTGLNLTAADYVYLLDPWWNPAVENQAIDRCYRIGQDKKVFAYRMICKNTVEEKIVKLQNRKKKIAGDIIQTDENIMKNLSSDDIKDLFG
ncbi:MAG: DEAD/DEAH box helicase [Salinivirgaceae bacterium]|jgi:SNF2 family DNA or RNA helicase|nr:DEAD/DEAH box helicase [Salinivirgaceae bacterium]